jgi:hypothetical protein
VVLFEPDREDAQMFFANIFSYRQRKRLCAQAYNKTRRNLQMRAAELAPMFARHGISYRLDRLHDTRRHITDAVSDPRPLHADAAERSTVSQTARDLGRTLDALERWLVRAA